jgi:hypothetical protein
MGNIDPNIWCGSSVREKMLTLNYANENEFLRIESGLISEIDVEILSCYHNTKLRGKIIE